MLMAGKYISLFSFNTQKRISKLEKPYKLENWGFGKDVYIVLLLPGKDYACVRKPYKCVEAKRAKSMLYYIDRHFGRETVY